MITVDIYERTRIIANSLRSITSNNVDKEITGVMQDRYRTSIARYVGENNAESARIFRLAEVPLTMEPNRKTNSARLRSLTRPNISPKRPTGINSDAKRIV